MNKDILMRRALWVSVAYNLSGALLFAFPSRGAVSKVVKLGPLPVKFQLAGQWHQPGQTRLGMTTHFSFDLELLGEAMSEVRIHYKGMFAFGIDHTVVNVTKDAVWIREAALPDTANTTRLNPQWLLQTMFGGVVPKEIVMPKVAHTVAQVQEQSVRDLEINPDKFTPPDQIRKWVREWPTDLTMDPAMLMGSPPAKK